MNIYLIVHFFKKLLKMCWQLKKPLLYLLKLKEVDMDKEKAKFELTSEIGDVIAKYDGLNLLDAIECLANAIEVIASIINKKK